MIKEKNEGKQCLRRERILGSEPEIGKKMTDQKDDLGKGHHSFCARHVYTRYLT